MYKHEIIFSSLPSYIPRTHFLTSARLLLKWHSVIIDHHAHASPPHTLLNKCKTITQFNDTVSLLTAMLMHHSLLNKCMTNGTAIIDSHAHAPPPTHSPQWYLLYNVHTKVFIEWKSKWQASSHYHLWVESQEVVDIEPVLLVITSDHWSAICWSVDLYWPQWAEQAEEWAIVSFSSPTPSSSSNTTSRGSWACAGGYDPPLEIWWEQWLKWLIWSLWHCWYTLATWLFDQLYQSMSERS